MARSQTGYKQKRFVKFRNNSGEAIEAWACVRVTGIEEETGLLLATKCTATAPWAHGIVSHRGVLTGGVGELTFALPAIVRYTSTLGEPVAGERWGPRPGFFTIIQADHVDEPDIHARFSILGIASQADATVWVGPC